MTGCIYDGVQSMTGIKENGLFRADEHINGWIVQDFMILIQFKDVSYNIFSKPHFAVIDCTWS